MSLVAHWSLSLSAVRLRGRAFASLLRRSCAAPLAARGASRHYSLGTRAIDRRWVLAVRETVPMESQVDDDVVRVGLLGCGNVGAPVVALLRDHAEVIRRRSG